MVNGKSGFIRMQQSHPKNRGCFISLEGTPSLLEIYLIVRTEFVNLRLG